MSTLSLTRRVRFRASHRYHRSDWTEAQNEKAFGEAALRELHEHEYWCDVTVSGPVDQARGMLVDLRTLDAVLQQDVVAALDGRNLNSDVAAFAGAAMPTTENLAANIAAVVQASLGRRGERARVIEVTVAEDPTLRATWRAAQA